MTSSPSHSLVARRCSLGPFLLELNLFQRTPFQWAVFSPARNDLATVYWSERSDLCDKGNFWEAHYKSKYPQDFSLMALSHRADKSRVRQPSLGRRWRWCLFAWIITDEVIRNETIGLLDEPRVGTETFLKTNSPATIKPPSMENNSKAVKNKIFHAFGIKTHFYGKPWRELRWAISYKDPTPCNYWYFFSAEELRWLIMGHCPGSVSL